MSKDQLLPDVALFEQLQLVLKLLPPEERQKGMVTSLEKVASFLHDFARALQMLPTQEQIVEKQIPQALDQIIDYLRGFGEIAKTSRSRRTSQRRAKTDVRPEVIMEQLATVPNEQLEERLRELNPTVAMLKEILDSLGASARGASKKEDLIRRVADELRTRRNLSGLRDNAAP